MTKQELIGRRATVTQRAVHQRLERRLKAEGKVLRSPRGRANRNELGDYFIVDTERNIIVESKLTEKKLEIMARRLDALATWEEVER